MTLYAESRSERVLLEKKRVSVVMEVIDEKGNKTLALSRKSETLFCEKGEFWT